MILITYPVKYDHSSPKISEPSSVLIQLFFRRLNIYFCVGNPLECSLITVGVIRGMKVSGKVDMFGGEEFSV
jgi:hypothetical protein